jgi:hypothetical protein
VLPVIVLIDDLGEGIVGVRAIGEFTVDDYHAVIAPRVAEIEGRHEQLRLLLHLGAEFTTFGEGEWGRLTEDIRTVPFHKGAVVTDVWHIRTGLNVLKWTLRGQVRTFSNRDYDQAARWVAS